MSQQFSYLYVVVISYICITIQYYCSTDNYIISWGNFGCSKTNRLIKQQICCVDRPICFVKFYCLAHRFAFQNDRFVVEKKQICSWFLANAPNKSVVSKNKSVSTNRWFRNSKLVILTKTNRWFQIIQISWNDRFVFSIY